MDKRKKLMGWVEVGDDARRSTSKIEVDSQTQSSTSPTHNRSDGPVSVELGGFV